MMQSCSLVPARVLVVLPALDDDGLTGLYGPVHTCCPRRRPQLVYQRCPRVRKDTRGAGHAPALRV